MEELKISALYKRGFNDVELLIEHNPELLKDMKVPDKEPDEYTSGFSDRLKLFERELALQKDFSIHELKEKYCKKQHKVKTKDLEKGLEKEH